MNKKRGKKKLTYSEYYKQARKNTPTYKEFYQNANPNLLNPPLSQIGFNLLTNEKIYHHKTHKELAHSHIIGATRFGKSNYLIGQVLNDIYRNDCGVCVLDPHGSLYKDILKHLALIKDDRKRNDVLERLVLFEPVNPILSNVGFNPIPNIQGNEIGYVADCLTNAFFLVWGQDPNEYPRILNWLQSLFYMTAKFQTKLSEVYRFLYEDDFREYYLRRLDTSDENENLIYLDLLDFNNLSPTKKNEHREGIRNRLKPFISNYKIKEILNCSKGVDFQDAMDNKKIVLMNLNGEKGNLFQLEQTRLLGNLIMNEIIRVGKKRDEDDPELIPCNIYIDEVGEIPSIALANALSGLAKNKVIFHLAHQSLSQIMAKNREGEPAFYHSVKTNCQNKIVFGGLNWDDADEMAKEFPELITLDKHKEFLYNFATVPYEDWTPVTQTIIEKSDSFKQDESQKISHSFTSQKALQVTEQDSSSFQIEYSNSETQAQEIAKILNNSHEYSSRESLVEAISNERSTSSTNTFTTQELNQMSHIIGTTHKETTTEQKRNSLANIISNAQSRVNEHAEGSMISNFVTNKNSQENRQTLARSLQNSIDKVESYSESNQRNQGSTYIDTQSNENFKSLTNTNAESQGHTNKNGSIQESSLSHGSVNESGIQQNLHPNNINFSQTTRNMNQNNQAQRNTVGNEDLQKYDHSKSTSDGSRNSTVHSHQLSSGMMDTVNNVLSNSTRQMQGNTQASSDASISSMEYGQQNNQTRNDIVRHGLQEITTQQQQEVSERIQSVALEKLDQHQQTHSITQIQSHAEQEMLKHQHSNSVEQVCSTAVSQMESLQERNSVSALVKVSINEMKVKSKHFAVSDTTSEGLQVDLSQNVSVGKGTTIKQVTKKQLVTRQAHMYEMTSKKYNLEEEIYLRTKLFKNQPVGYVIVQMKRQSLEKF